MLTLRVIDICLENCNCRKDAWVGVAGGGETPPPVPLNETLLMAPCRPRSGSTLRGSICSHDLISR